MMMTELEMIGIQCAELRRNLHIRQQTVAEETGYSMPAISGFENGRNNNAKILLWYLRHGLPIPKGDYFNG